MKTRILIEIDKEDADFETRALLLALKNQLAIDSLYDDVFRPVIKYKGEEDIVMHYESMREVMKEHFQL